MADGKHLSLGIETSNFKELVMYLARDKNNDLYLFDKTPLRGKECWWAESGVDGTYLRLSNTRFTEVTWESEPVPVVLSVVADSTGLESP
jgi:hypothetical protein